MYKGVSGWVNGLINPLGGLLLGCLFLKYCFSLPGFIIIVWDNIFLVGV